MCFQVCLLPYFAVILSKRSGHGMSAYRSNANSAPAKSGSSTCPSSLNPASSARGGRRPRRICTWAAPIRGYTNEWGVRVRTLEYNSDRGVRLRTFEYNSRCGVRLRTFEYNEDCGVRVLTLGYTNDCGEYGAPHCVCVCVCVCDAQIFQIMLKLRGSTMMRPNHEFFCSVALLPGFRNWVEMTCNMQQEGVGLVLLPRPASLVRSPVLPCAEAPLGESTVLLGCCRDAGRSRSTSPTPSCCMLHVCVCVCVTPKSFKLCSKCEVQQHTQRFLLKCVCVCV